MSELPAVVLLPGGPSGPLAAFDSRLKRQETSAMSTLLRFRDISMSDLPQVGGKNASLGEMVSRLHEV